MLATDAASSEQIRTSQACFEHLVYRLFHEHNATDAVRQWYSDVPEVVLTADDQRRCQKGESPGAGAGGGGSSSRWGRGR